MLSVGRLGWLLLGCLCMVGAFGSCDSQPHRVGVLLPQTGRFSPWGTEALQGLTMALDEANASRQPHDQIELVVADNMSIDSGTTAGFQRLVERGATVVIGPLTTDLAMVAAGSAASHEVPMVSPSATGEEFTRGNLYAFRYCFTDPEVARALAYFARHDLGLSRLAVAVDLGSRYSLGLGREFSRAFVTRHGRIVDEVAYYDDPKDLAQVLDRVAELDVEGVLLAGYHDSVVAMIEGATDARVKKLVLLGSDGWEGPRIAAVVPGKVAQAYYTSHFSPGERQVPSERQTLVDGFVSHYQSEHEGPWPTDFVALGYDVGRAVFSIFDEGLDGNEMRLRFRNLRREGVTGSVQLNSQGDPVNKSIVFEELHTPGGPHFWSRSGN
ncbi:MAG: branched-chain amino acid transport system substrate-binding protein [Pseudohongiellaceae bacterium]|jgi:branched-chain amino acid transport system substrate-binding protein